MKRSSDRILTTHVGSLIRPAEIQDFLQTRTIGDPYPESHNQLLAESVRDVVRRQSAAGIDVVSDGEFGKPLGWSMYALDRLSGFEQRLQTGPSPASRSADRQRFAEFYSSGAPGIDGGANSPARDSVCIGPIEYTGLEQLKNDIANFKAALDGVDVEEAFLPVAAPSSAIPDRKNEYYASDEECVQALADAMATEYRTIVESGLLLQIDDARAAVTYDRMVPPGTLQDFQAWVERHTEALNSALAGLPSDRIRYHVCWGSWPGPHSTDVPLKDIAPIVLKVNADAFVIEGANPRHEHEWKVWRDIPLPEGKILVPGVISHATNIVEHPELVAERIVRYAEVVGRENVIAGTDCGFAQGPTTARVHPSIQWAKLESLAEGARLASEELWG
jgi:5-methyltetrahydropteroyltriglutamate--homocysteine methyltransferase